MSPLLLARLPLVLAFVALIVVPAEARAQDQRLEQAIEEAGALDTPIAQIDTPVGRLALERAELLAGRNGQPIRLTLTLDRDVDAGTLTIAIPKRWRTVPASGLRASTPPRGRRVGNRREVVEMRLDDTRAGDRVTAEIRDTGIPAGTWTLPVRYANRKVGRLELRLYAPVREAPENPWRAMNVTADSSTQSETFITAVPGNPDRVLVGANNASTGYDAWITTNGGQTWARRAVPTSADVPGRNNPIKLDLCCDPMSAADAAGNLWYGGLSDGNSSRIHVSRIAAGTTTFVNTVGLPRRTNGVQDKPMMTIDNSPASPTFGRLYVVWNEPAGAGINVVMTMCDSRPDPARCDNADSWSPPISITKATGSYIYADVAVGPGGRAYVTWWDYSNANAVRGSVCSSNCGSAASWSGAQTIAIMNSTGGPLPFACPIIAQPGGRASTAPNVDVDISGTASNGRVWVSWSDLRAGSGTTRCDEDLQPALTHLTFDSFAATAMGQLPGGASPSAQVATRLLADGEGGGTANSDDWFPWLAVDQTSGQAYVDFYSTREDGTRRTTHFYVRKLAPDGTLGALTRVSTAPSDYSAAPCCGFGNDYGDYTGLDATSGYVFPVWSDKTGPDGEAFADRVQLVPPTLEPGDLAVTDPAPDGDGDGVREPGEILAVTVPVTNSGEAPAAVTGSLTTSDPKVTILSGSASYGTIDPGGTGQPQAPYRIRLDRTIACGASVPLVLTATAPGQSGTRSYSLSTGPSCAITPRAAIAGPATALTGQQVTFDAGTSTDLDGTIAAYEWDLDGDDTFDPGGAQVSTTYATAGPRDVAVRVTDDDGLTDTASMTITVSEPPNQPPVAVITGPALAHAGDTVQFSAAGSSDGDGSIARYEWDLDGNGTFEADTGTAATAETSFAAGGARTISVRVTDNKGATAEDGTEITINTKPTVSLSGPDSAKVNRQVQVSATAADPDGSIASYRFDLDANGTFETETGTTATATTSFATPGDRTIGVRVADDDGATATATKTVTIVANALPVAALAAPDSARVNAQFQVSAAGSADSDGSLTRYEFDLDDNGTFETDSEQPTATTSFATGGPKTVRVRVTDDDGATATATEGVTIVPNVPPSADLTGPDGIKVGRVVALSAAASSDSDGSIARYEFDLDADGTYETDRGTEPTATTSFDEPGQKVLGVRVTDNEHATGTATKSITVVANVAPTAVIAAPASAIVGQTVILDGSASNDSDGTIRSYEFDVEGDGTFSGATSHATAQTSFGSPGTYLLRVRVTDDDGAAATAQQSIVIDPAPAPEPTVTAPANPAPLPSPVTPQSAPAVALVERRVKIRRRRIRLRLVGCAACRGTIELRRRGRRLARKRYKLSAEGTATVRIKLRKPRRMRVKVRLKVRDGTGRFSFSTSRLIIRRRS